ncbi:hypothetical protein [Sphaerospermopsis torques-reginae]|uniref:Transmembrane protein n=1 Tax=Sphaerospermopsis torques-reginae ITEP-024 TaxID=984208 RepID=A0ABX8WUD4_9CYAN|nr:hypothetical protein [Sphaerospermopsis torques-reginae]QYX30005.1 hypothetical protein K2F26_13595 [Sphaerospermopsis torques-reginae ITEP-024]
MNSIQIYILQNTTNPPYAYTDYPSFILLIIAIAIIITVITFFFKSKPTENDPPNTKNNILFLTINQTNQNLIHDLKTNHQITSNNYQELFSATRSLCFLDSDSDLYHQINNWFTEILQKPESPEGNEFDLDIYIVKIVLDHNYPKFQFEATFLEKIDYFKRIPENSQEVLISPRLSPQDYQSQSKHFYRK